jgi:hypothetical protein
MKEKYYVPDFLNIPSEDQRETLPQFTQKGLDQEIDSKTFDQNKKFWAYIRDAAGFLIIHRLLCFYLKIEQFLRLLQIPIV